MNFVVEYRDQSGVRKTLELDVVNRDAVWAELKKRGIKAISVNERTGKSATWNRPKTSVTTNRGRSAYNRFRVWGLIISVLVVLAIGLLSLIRHDDKTNAADPEKARSAKQAKSTNVPKTGKPSSVKVSEPKEEKMHWGVPHSEWVKLSHEEKVALGQAAYDAEAAKIDSTYLERKRMHDADIASRPFKHLSENIIANIFSLRLGDPILMGDLPTTLEADFLKSLNQPIEINPDDSEETKQLKKEMIELKPQLKKMMDEGHTLEEILNDYRKSIAKVYDLELNLRRELDNIKRTATSVDDVKDFIEAANQMMINAGAESFTYELSKGAIRKILINAERAKQEKPNE